MPGQEGRRRRQKRPGFNLPFPILLPFRKETRGERDRLAENGGNPHPAKEEPPPFLARRMLFWPGRGLICPTGKHLSSEPIENTAFSKRIQLFFSTKLEMIQNNEPHLLFFMISDQPEIGKKISIALLWIQLAGIPGQPVSKSSFSCRELFCRNFPGRFLRNQNLKSTRSLVYGENGRGGGEILQMGNSMRGRGVFQQMPTPRGLESILRNHRFGDFLREHQFWRKKIRKNFQEKGI